MEIIFLGTGPETPVRGNGRNNRSNSSLLVKLEGKNILIDASPMIMEQLFENAIDKIDAILLTHSHHTCVKGISYCSKNFKELPVFALEQTFETINKYYGDLNIVKNVIKPNETFELFGDSIFPIEINHAESFDGKTKYPCVAYKFKNSLYAPSVESIPNESLKYFKNLDTLILDASMYFDKKIKSHLNLNSSLKIANTHKPKKTILTHIGHTYPEHYKVEKKIGEYCESNGFKIDVNLAYDGLTYEIKKLGEILDEKKSIYLKAPLPENIFNNKGKYFFRFDNLKELLGINLYLVDDKFCYGIVELVNIKEMKLEDLERIQKENKELKDISKIIENKKLFAYETKIITKFPRKKSIKRLGNLEDFCNSFEFVKDKVEKPVEVKKVPVKKENKEIDMDKLLKQKEIELKNKMDELDLKNKEKEMELMAKKNKLIDKLLGKVEND